MAILTGEKLKEIFNGFFEDGNDGKNNNAGIPAVINKPVAGRNNVSLTGLLKTEGNNLFIESETGLVFRLLLTKPEGNIETLAGKTITVTGTQQGDVIADAIINSGGRMTVKTYLKKVKPRNEEQVLALAKSVKRFFSKYRDKISGLLTVRPGYKYINGEITSIPAIVAVVEKKTNLSSLNKAEVLPASFDNFDVEVISASPKDLLIHKFSKEHADSALVAKSIQPSLLESYVADTALPQELTEAAGLLLTEAAEIDYRPPAHLKLEEVSAAMTLICHVSPEGGWKTLGPFLDETTDSLQVAMYDFSAPQIYDSLKTIARRGAGLKLVYDGNPAANLGKGTKINDVKEETIINGLKRIAGRNFEYVKAWKGKEGICANSYHIKVAIKDGEAFWLSSGNWQTSNQPNEDFDNNINLLPKYNREWNILVNNKKLASTYEKFLSWDFERSQEKPEAELMEIALPEIFIPEEEPEIRETSRYMLFPPKKFVFTRSRPVRIQPVLSPDNYLEYALKIIRSAKNKLYFQNQYIKMTAEITAEYDELLNALIEKSNDETIDCRIILRSQNANDVRVMLDDLQAVGFNMSKIKVMTNTHTKGIIADNEVVMIGSHNWSNSGVQFNRDASLVIYDGGVAQYYEDVFLHDWERRTIRKRDEEITIISGAGAETSLIAENMVQLDWREYLT